MGTDKTYGQGIILAASQKGVQGAKMEPDLLARITSDPQLSRDAAKADQTALVVGYLPAGDSVR